MVNHGNADAERISEMHRRHGGERIDIVSLHPDGLCIVAADAVEESILRGKKTWWHAWVEDEDTESHEVSESHCSTDGCKSCVRWCYVVPESDESKKEVLLVRGIFFPNI